MEEIVRPKSQTSFVAEMSTFCLKGIGNPAMWRDCIMKSRNFNLWLSVPLSFHSLCCICWFLSNIISPGQLRAVFARWCLTSTTAQVTCISSPPHPNNLPSHFQSLRAAFFLPSSFLNFPLSGLSSTLLVATAPFTTKFLGCKFEIRLCYDICDQVMLWSSDMRQCREGSKWVRNLYCILFVLLNIAAKDFIEVIMILY